MARALCFGVLFFLSVPVEPAHAEPLLTGINVPNATRANPADRQAVINQLKTAGVRIVRFPVGNDVDDLVGYASQLYAQGIRLNLIVDPQYPPKTPIRPPYPQDSHMYPSFPLSDADPTLSRDYFQILLSKLDASGVVLASIELGNEINWSAFNGDFPLPGEGRIFGLDDLSHDPEGKPVASGLLQYLKILAVLKDARDHSRLNKTTPIISAGLSPTGRARVVAGGSREDGVGIEATIQFLRANGLDKLVDGYGIHFYPWGTVQQVDLNLQNNVVAPCQPAVSGNGKPCWVTEWGIVNHDMSCPLNDNPRVPMIQHMIDSYRALASAGRLKTILYYSWNSSPGTKPDPITIFRCGSITEGGRIALKP
jgi:hypothetical protein